jgi:peptidoglycan/xylan/chitin deacetylase (PgdA/CDA1 family)
VFAWHVKLAAEPADDDAPALILVYHRFGAEVGDSMTVKTATFEWQLRYLAEHGYPVIPLRRVVDCRRGQGRCPDRCSVVITADDGHRSVYSEMLPVVTRFDVPVTLFVYPSAISRADYALTWDQLRELVRSGRFDVQSHSYWHPNFRIEKQRLPAAEYRRFVSTQLEKPRAIIRRELGTEVDLLSWPFGIYDAELERLAIDAGYIAAFTLESRPVRAGDDLMALPRHLVSDDERDGAFARLLAGACR